MFYKSIDMFKGVLGSILAESRWLLMSQNKFKLVIPLPGYFNLPRIHVSTIETDTKSNELIIEGVVKQEDGREGGGWFERAKKI